MKCTSIYMIVWKGINVNNRLKNIIFITFCNGWLLNHWYIIYIIVFTKGNNDQYVVLLFYVIILWILNVKLFII